MPVGIDTTREVNPTLERKQRGSAFQTRIGIAIDGSKIRRTVHTVSVLDLAIHSTRNAAFRQALVDFSSVLLAGDTALGLDTEALWASLRRRSSRGVGGGSVA